MAICRAASRSSCGFRTRPASARRTGSSVSGPDEAPDRASRPTSATRMPGYSARSAPPAARRRGWRCRSARSRRLAYDAETQTAAQHQPDLSALTRAGVEPRRKRLAVPPRQLAVQHRLRRHRAHHRRRMHRLEQPRRTPRRHPIHWSQAVGSHRSETIAVGIRHRGKSAARRTNDERWRRRKTRPAASTPTPLQLFLSKSIPRAAIFTGSSFPYRTTASYAVFMRGGPFHKFLTCPSRNHRRRYVRALPLPGWSL